MAQGTAVGQNEFLRVPPDRRRSPAVKPGQIRAQIYRQARHGSGSAAGRPAAIGLGNAHDDVGAFVDIFRPPDKGAQQKAGRSGHRQGEGLRPQVLHIDDKGNPVFLGVPGGVEGAAQGRYGAVNRVGLFPALEIGPHPAGKEPMAEKPPQTYIFRVARLGQKGDLCRQGEVPFPPGLLGPVVKIRCHQLHPMFPAQTPGQADEAAGAVGVEVRDEVGQQENVHTAAPFSRLRAGKPIHRPVARSSGNARMR